MGEHPTTTDLFSAIKQTKQYIIIIMTEQQKATREAIRLNNTMMMRI